MAYFPSIKKFIIAIVVLSALIIGGSYLYKTLASIKPPVSLPTSNRNQLPIDVNNPSFKQIVISYEFEGKIVDISKNQSVKKLTLTVQPTNSNPQTVEMALDEQAFTLDPLQAKNATEAAQIKRIKVSELTAGTSVRVFASYDLKTNKTTSSQVIVLSEK